MDIGGNKLKAVQAKVDAISNNIDQVTGQITKTTVGVTTSKRFVSSQIHIQNV